MSNRTLNIILADDDEDDRFFFEEALSELPHEFELATAVDGMDLIELLRNSNPIPDLIFLDLNMPRKNGVETLTEIMSDPMFINAKVVIYSTSYDLALSKRLFELGARHYIQKPSSFDKLQSSIFRAIEAVTQSANAARNFENFLISG